jgi:MFS family permease
MGEERAASPLSSPQADAADDRRMRHNARWYFTGLAASLVGNSAMSLIAGIWVKDLTGSSSQAGLVSACIYAPTLIAPVAGVIADRVPRKTWLFWINVVSAVTILPLLAVRSRAELWIIFAVMAAYGIEATLNDPAEDALFAEMFTRQFRQRISGSRLAIQETGRLLAPLFGAAIFVAVGGGAVAALDAATFVVAAAAVFGLQLSGRVHVGLTEPLRQAFVAGARHIWQTPSIRTVAIAATAIMALSGAGVAAQYSLVAGLGQRPAFLAIFNATLGAGSIIASLIARHLISRIGEPRLALLGLINFAAGNALRSIPSLPSAVLGSLVLGFALPWVFLAILNVAMNHTPTELQGRVSGTLTLALFGPQAPMQALGALLIAHATYVQIYLVSAVLSLVLALWLALRTRKITESTEAPRPGEGEHL